MPSVSEATSIRVEDLSVTYRTSLERKPTLRGTLLRLGRRERVVREIEAVKDVSFEVKRGGSFVGYGLELEGRHGNLPYIGRV